MDIKKLRQDRVDAFNAAKALHAAAVGGVMTTEAGVQYDAHMANVATLDTNIARAQQMLDAERTAPAIQVEVSLPEASKRPFASLGEQLIAVKNYAVSQGRVRDERLFASAAGQNETIDTEGGFLVGTEVAPDLLTRTIAAGMISSRCRTRPMSSPRLVLNGIDDANRVGGPAGAGILVVRAAEAANINFSKIKLRRTELNANKLMGFYMASDEVLKDAPALQSEINDYFPEAFSWVIDNEILNGGGAGQFLGILQSGAKVVQAIDAGQTLAANPITTQNVLNMISRLWIRSRATAAFFVGPDAEAYLPTLTIPGAAGTAVALYTPPGTGFNSGKYGLLRGIPVIPVEQTAALGTQGDFILADCDQYLIGKLDDVQFASSIHVQFLTDQQVFRWTMRNDGAPLWDKPVTQNNSANKVSPFVILATRT